MHFPIYSFRNNYVLNDLLKLIKMFLKLSIHYSLKSELNLILNFRVQANYLISRYVVDSLSYLTKELRQRHVLYNKYNNTTRLTECIDITTQMFEIVISSTYVRRYFDKNSKQNALDLVYSIKDELYKILSSNEWMDDETR